MQVSFKSHEDYIQLSQDASPIHVDASFAINVGFGGKVVHGAHLLELSLQEILSYGELKIVDSIRADFFTPVYVDQEFLMKVETTDSVTTVLIESGETRHARIMLRNVPANEPNLGFSIGLTNQVLSAGIRALSRHVGMVDPGPAAILRKIEIYQGGDEFKSELGGGIRIHTSRIGMLNFTASSLINRHMNIDHEIKSATAAIGPSKLPQTLDGTQILIVGFGTLGKIFLEIFAAGTAQNRQIFIMSTNPTKVLNYLSLRNFPTINIKILSLTDAIPDQIDLVFYTASPKIVSENPNNYLDLQKTYQNVYLNQLLQVDKRTKKRKGLFYPSSTYLDDEPENYKIYSGVKRESERMLLANNAEHPSTICIVRLPAFASRHHSFLIPTQGEKTIEEITKVISDTLGKWLATLQLLID